MSERLVRRRHLIATVALAALAPGRAAAARIAGVNFDDAAQVGGQTIALNGVGVRAVAWFKGYAAGLYLAQPSRTAEAAVSQPGAKRLQMRMLVDVPAEEFIKAFHKGVGRNVPSERQGALAERMARFDALMRQIGEVKGGDVVNLDYLPARGLQLALNGAARGEPIPGEDLYAAMLLVFLGDRPVDARLKAGLLGTKG